MSWGLWFCGGWFLKWVLPWVLQIADVVVLLWVSGFGFVCVCVFFCGSCSGCFSWLLVVIFAVFFFFFSLSLGGFCGGYFLRWLLLVVGLVVFLMGFGDWHGGGEIGRAHV